MFKIGDYVEYKNDIYRVTELKRDSWGDKVFLIKSRGVFSGLWARVKENEIKPALVVWYVTKEKTVHSAFSLDLNFTPYYLAWFQNEDDAKAYADNLS